MILSSQAYSGVQKPDDREKIQWIKFEQSDINGKTIKSNFDMQTFEKTGSQLY